MSFLIHYKTIAYSQPVSLCHCHPAPICLSDKYEVHSLFNCSCRDLMLFGGGTLLIPLSLKSTAGIYLH